MVLSLDHPREIYIYIYTHQHEVNNALLVDIGTEVLVVTTGKSSIGQSQRDGPGSSNSSKSAHVATYVPIPWWV